jgi:TRAP-type C4-dicarboxylate transport system substrate-binding protein
LSFASADPNANDVLFMRTLAEVSGGAVIATLKHYDDDAADVDVAIARDLLAGRLDVVDVGARAWESVGSQSFRGYQAPYVATRRSQLLSAASPTAAAPLLESLQALQLRGLAVLPIGLRYVFSTRPLRTPHDYAGATVRVNQSPTTQALITALGARPDNTSKSGQALDVALRAGRVTAVESDMRSALGNGYVTAAPYVAVNLPLFSKVTSLVASSRRLEALDPQVSTWLKQAADVAAARAAGVRDEPEIWAAACSGGLRPLTLDPAQVAAFVTAATPVARSINEDRYAGIAVAALRTAASRDVGPDPWAHCP